MSGQTIEGMPTQEHPSLLPRITLALLLLLALGVRLFGLTNPPFDYNPTRQLRSAMIARGMYYAGLETAPEWQRQMAVRQWRAQEVLEPTILEAMVAASYRLAGGEILWISRVFSSLLGRRGSGAVPAGEGDRLARRGVGGSGLLPLPALWPCRPAALSCPIP